MLENSEIRYIDGGWFVFVDGVQQEEQVIGNDPLWDGANKVVLDGNVPDGTEVSAGRGADIYVIDPTLAHNIAINDGQVTDGEFNVIKFASSVIIPLIDFGTSYISITLSSGSTITVGSLSTTRFQIGEGTLLTAAELSERYNGTGEPDNNGTPIIQLVGVQTLTITENINTLAEDTGVRVTLPGSDNVIFTISDERFEIIEGALRVKADQMFDYETDHGVSITITGTDESTGEVTLNQEFAVEVMNINETPQLVRSTLAANAEEIVILNATDLLVTDVDAADGAADLTYTVMDGAVSTGVLQRFNDGIWMEVPIGSTFTQENLNAGSIRFIANEGTDGSDTAFVFSVTDGGENAVQSVTVTLATGIRTVETVSNEESDNTIDVFDVLTPRIIDTGDGRDGITAGQGNDQIDAGRGDDTIDLSAGGADDIYYGFGADGTAQDGGDRITGFKRGEDTIIFKESDMDSSTATTLVEFLSNARGENLDSFHDDLFIITPDYVKDDGEFFITGVTFNFQDAGVYNSNKLSSGLLTITFDTRIAWDYFLDIIGGEEQIDAGLFALKNPAVLIDLLGMDSFGFEELMTPNPDNITTGTVTITHEESSMPTEMPNVGEVLTAVTTGLTDIDDYNLTFAYQWQLDGANIAGATSATHLAVRAGAYSVIVMAHDSIKYVNTEFVSADFAVIAAGSDLTGSVTENTPGSVAASGSIIMAGDGAAAYTQSFKAGQHIALDALGTFTIDAAGVWNYQLNGHDGNLNTAWQVLGNVGNFDAGESFTVTYSVTTIMGTQSTVEDVTLTINGITDIIGTSKNDIYFGFAPEGQPAGSQFFNTGDQTDFIDTRGRDNGTVIASGLGTDNIVLNQGTTDTVIHRFSSTESSWRQFDGSDRIRDFTRGTDKLVLVDVDDSTPIMNLADFLTALPNSGSIITAQISAGEIRGVHFHLPNGGAINSADPQAGFGGNNLEIEFDLRGDLQLIGDHSDKFNASNVLTDFSFFAELFGTSSLDVVALDEVGITFEGANPPTELVIANAVTSLDENIDTLVPTKVAEFVVTDGDGDFTYNALSGADADLFNIVGNSLFLRAGILLDFETNETLDVTVSITGTNLSQDVSIAVADINEASTALVMSNEVTILPENVDTTSYVKVADLAVTDVDAGFIYVLSGADADLFTMIGDVLFLQEGAALDFETNPMLDVTVSIDGTELSQSLTIALTDTEEGDATYSVTGDLQLGGVVTASLTSADPDGVTGVVNYQWQIKAGTDSWNNITGATASTYTLTQSEVAHQIRVKVTYLDDFGVDETVYGMADAVISAIVREDVAGAVSASGTVGVVEFDEPVFSQNFKAGQNTALDMIGTFTVDASTGAWNYELNGNDAQLNAVWSMMSGSFNFVSGDSFTVIYSITASNGSVTTIQDVPIIIQGITDIIGSAGDETPVFYSIGSYDESTDAQFFNTGAGYDAISAGSGGDVIAAGRGADSINLGAGDDTLIHRFSSDGTSWTQTDSGDTVNDFTRGSDKLVLVDVDTDTPVINLTDFLAALPGSGGVVTVGVGSDGATNGKITSVALTLPNGGVVDSIFSVPGTDGRTLNINFDTEGPLQNFADHNSKFSPNKQLVTYTFLDELFGTSSLDVMASVDLGIAIL